MRRERTHLLKVGLVLLVAAGLPVASARPASASPVSVVSIGDGSVLEGDVGKPPLGLELTLSAPSATDTLVTYTVAPGTATPKSDYLPPKNGVASARIPAGKTAASINVRVVADTIPEPDETFTVTLLSTDNLGITIGRALGTATILDDDSPIGDPPQPTIGVGDVRVVEGNAAKTPAKFMMTLSEPLATDLVVTYVIVPGTAQAVSDFVAKATPRTATIRAGRESFNVSVPVLGETRPEPDETFTVQIVGTNDPVIALRRATGTATILDDDDHTPTAGNDTGSVLENGTVHIDVLTNDSDPDAGDTLTVTSVDTTGTAGKVTNNGTDVTYDPNGAFDYLGQGDSAHDTFGYAVTDLYGRTATASVDVTVNGGTLTVALRNDSDPTDPEFLSLGGLVTGVIDGSQDTPITAVVGNLPSDGVTYHWTVATPNAADFTVAPVQTRSSLFIISGVIPDFTPQAVVISLTVTPNNGSAPISVAARVRYVNSATTIAASSSLGIESFSVTTSASPNPAGPTDDITINNTPHIDSASTQGTVTYYDGTTLLGSADFGTDFVIPAGTLTPGTHHINAFEELYVNNGAIVAKPAFTNTVDVDVTGGP